MKRINGLFDRICTKENIDLADKNARKDKGLRRSIIKHDANKEAENNSLLMSLMNLTYETSQYKTFTIYEPKERLIFKLPYYPDRITHHAIMNVMEPIWVNLFIKNTYSCIKERGIHKLNRDLKRCLHKHRKDTVYCLKLDIRKFYPSIKHEVLIDIIKHKVKDNRLIELLIGIISSSDGVPIGNYLSQFFANLYLTYFDHWLKEEVKCRFYFRYADDIVILAKTKAELEKIMILIKMYFHHVLNIDVKGNYQIFDIEERGIDFIGYVFRHDYILLRKSIRQSIMRLVRKYVLNKIDKIEFEVRFKSYFGWCKYCDSKSLLKKIELLTGIKYSNWVASYVKISYLCGKRINVIDIDARRKYYKINFVYKGHGFYTVSQDKNLYNELIENTLPKVITI